jgi:hypothetical protein
MNVSHLRESSARPASFAACQSLVPAPTRPPAIRAAKAAFGTAQIIAIVNHFTDGCSLNWHK